VRVEGASWSFCQREVDGRDVACFPGTIDTFPRLHRIVDHLSGRTALVTSQTWHASYHISTSDMTHPLRPTPLRRCAQRRAGLHILPSFRNGMQLPSPGVEVTPPVASPDQCRVCTPILLMLLCASFNLGSAGLPSHGIALAQEKQANGWRAIVPQTTGHHHLWVGPGR
jgi:hypothetical protein